MVVDGIRRHVRNKMVLSGLIDENDGGSGHGDGASDLETGIILAGAGERG